LNTTDQQLLNNVCGLFNSSGYEISELNLIFTEFFIRTIGLNPVNKLFGTQGRRMAQGVHSFRSSTARVPSVMSVCFNGWNMRPVIPKFRAAESTAFAS